MYNMTNFEQINNFLVLVLVWIYFSLYLTTTLKRHELAWLRDIQGWVINSYYPDMGEGTEGQAYAARGLHFKINSYSFSLFSRVREIESKKNDSQ